MTFFRMVVSEVPFSNNETSSSVTRDSITGLYRRFSLSALVLLSRAFQTICPGFNLDDSGQVELKRSIRASAIFSLTIGPKAPENSRAKKFTRAGFKNLSCAEL